VRTRFSYETGVDRIAVKLGGAPAGAPLEQHAAE
jgi:hypothetical protein